MSERVVYRATDIFGTYKLGFLSSCGFNMQSFLLWQLNNNCFIIDKMYTNSNENEIKTEIENENETLNVNSNLNLKENFRDLVTNVWAETPRGTMIEDAQEMLLDLPRCEPLSSSMLHAFKTIKCKSGITKAVYSEKHSTNKKRQSEDSEVHSRRITLLELYGEAICNCYVAVRADMEQILNELFTQACLLLFSKVEFRIFSFCLFNFYPNFDLFDVFI